MITTNELYRKTLLTIAGNPRIERLTIKYGKSLARRFIASEHLDGALTEVRKLNEIGIMATLDHLGEGIQELEQATGYRDEYIRLIEGISKSKVQSNVSLKPTQMGLALDPEACYQNIRAVAREAKYHRNFVRIDMEDSPYTEATLQIVERLHREGLTNVGTVIQAYLFRTEADVQHCIEHHIPLRLVKGAYKEPAAIAYQNAKDVRSQFERIIQLHLDQDVYTAIASHDDRIIQFTKRYAAEHSISKERFEFQMLYGLRIQEQERLAAEGYRVRCYVPYGTMWYPYYTRRLAEKPGNLMLVLKNMVR
ncbi:proline dehydrogenase family protein [Paenibacillus sp. PDC88]|uniref:proline dehydrogenase family protein n=1 Tax=Paenibacillus sp. PDC88 TaxID=1884375 RepID=UPI000898A432|nr:L-proline dehydrogenase [Paenibacillus sp. PDC88]